ncbi:MAG TPA: hypothetical protein VMH26_05320 [Burkholderiales bacterium]|nr:hypothetical protein [Burkholderiales bacterium]
MKTTIELPDPLFRRAKSKAAAAGMTLKQFFTEAIQDKLAARSPNSVPAEPAWMQGFGKLRRLRKETQRVQKVIDKEFEVVEPEDRL